MTSLPDCDGTPDTEKTAEPPKPSRSTLVSRNVTIAGHRTSVRLEPEMWSGLSDICRRERMTIHEVCTAVAMRKHGDTSLTAAIRVFVMAYFRAATTEDGHTKAGHGYGVTIAAGNPNPTVMPPPPRQQVAVGMSAFALSSGKLDNGTRRF